MSSFENLLVKVAKPVKTGARSKVNPMEAAYAALRRNLDEQRAAYQYILENGGDYMKTKTYYREGKKLDKEVKTRVWWWKDESGEYYFAPRHGTKLLLGEGLALKGDVIQSIDNTLDALEHGQLDKHIQRNIDALKAAHAKK